ncbi:thioesterase family protein [Ktedonosporobacter rubrisoli]|uniref:Thioesterase family protein n=1 Tax=Ktedonosporobacter rubrisoli TaxID=2509675 RepID=A0A4P6JNR4_KTERU|nr:thioesterase family protein [Ktedonosporobacter rubrisoli]QBD76760.1 thioesterase family protein [Ktedonosporobacter rubrisoli]
MTIPAFWIPEEDDIFRATIHTQGPWNPQFQHGGPPGALLVRQMERCSPREDMQLARVTIDILGPVPITTLRAHARLVRPGRSVELLEAFLDHDGRTVMHASGWRIRLPSRRPPAPEADMPPALAGQELDPTPEWRCGFLLATEWRFVRGSYTQAGSALAWTRLRYPLIEGEMPSPAQRLIAAADSANGISSPLDIRDWQFIPPELTLHCLRPPVGEWICMDATTILQAEGVGLTTSNLYDQEGLVGRSAQSLLISHRG